MKTLTEWHLHTLDTERTKLVVKTAKRHFLLKNYLDLPANVDEYSTLFSNTCPPEQ